MTTIPALRPSARDRLADTAAEAAAPSLLTLTRVELRKTVDTRAGRWLLIVIGVLCLGVVVIQLFSGGPAAHTFDAFLATAQLPAGVLLPVLGILAVTSEWSQRTALTTFTLVPDRARIVIAKVLAGFALSVLATAACLAAAATGTAFAQVTGRGGAWSAESSTVSLAFLFQAVNLLAGVAFGLLLLSSALAIVLFFVVPTAFTIITFLVGALREPATWVDLGRSLEPVLTGDMTGTAWAKLAASATVWVLLPLAAGTIRLLRREVT